MNILAILFAATTTTSAPQCTTGEDAAQTLAVIRESPTPLGLILGKGSDWGAKYLVVKTTHQLGVPMIKGKEGTEKVVYYSAGREKVCIRELEFSACPQLDLAIRAFRGRSYSVMHNRSQLRLQASFHPPFALLHAQDADGNTTKITVTESEHPLMYDATRTFSGIERCTKDVDDLAGAL